MQAVDAADLSLLPGLFRALEQDFGVGPKGLASLVLSQSILKGLAYPAWCAQRPRTVARVTRCLADWQSAASHCHTVALWRVIQGRGVRPLPAEACAMGGVCCMGGGGCDCHCLHHLRATRYLPRGRRHRASLPDAGLTIHDERYHPGAQTRHGLRADADSR